MFNKNKENIEKTVFKIVTHFIQDQENYSSKEDYVFYDKKHKKYFFIEEYIDLIIKKFLKSFEESLNRSYMEENEIVFFTKGYLKNIEIDFYKDMLEDIYTSYFISNNLNKKKKK